MNAFAELRQGFKCYLAAKFNIFPKYFNRKMSLEIVRIEKNGDASQEYVVLKAIKAVNLSDYALVDRTFDEAGNVSNIYRHFYRFPSQRVEEGEYVLLRTNKGTYKYGTTKEGNHVHSFHWGSDAPIWNDANVESAELLMVKTLSKKGAGHTTTETKPKIKFKLPGSK